MNDTTFRPIGLIHPMSQALRHVGRILFDPFDLGKWFLMGFGAWLASLGKGGGPHFNFNFNFDKRGFHQVQEFIRTNPHILPIAITAVIVGLLLSVLILWISSRGKFIFLYCVVTNRALVKYPWTQFRPLGNSLFRFRLVIWILGMVVLGLVAAVGIGAFLILNQSGGDTGMALIMVIAASVIIGIPTAIIFWLIISMTEDFVVPIMARRGLMCFVAWKVFWSLLKDHFGRFVLYWLFKILLGIVIFLIVVVFGMGTCCIGFILLMIPYIGAVVLLPIRCFSRSFSLFYLRQYGADYDVFPSDPGIAAPAVPTTAGGTGSPQTPGI